MGVNIRQTFRGVLGICISFSVLAEPLPITDEDVISYMELRVREQYELVNQVVDSCETTRKNAVAKLGPEQFDRQFRELNLSAYDAMVAVTYIGIRNHDFCSSAARQELLFRASALDQALGANGRSVRIRIGDADLTYAELLGMALVPGIGQHKLMLRYEALPSHAKAFMDQYFGTIPFNHMMFLRALSEDDGGG